MPLHLNRTRGEQTVIVRLEGGLGNQMFQYAMGRNVAWSNNCPLKLDLQWFQAQSKRQYELSHFNIVAEEAEDGALRSVLGPRLFLPLINLADKFRLPHKKRLITEKGFNYEERLLPLRAPVYLRGYWQSPRYFCDIASLLRKEFTLKAPLSAEGDLIFQEISRTVSVAIHFRRGDYVTENPVAEKHGTCSVGYYQQAMSNILHLHPDAVFYCFSDDPTWVREHISMPASAVYVDLSSKDWCVEELFLMTQCCHHIISNSTFGWWGAWLARRGGVTIAPREWFRDATIDTGDLFPSQWVLL